MYLKIISIVIGGAYLLLLLIFYNKRSKKISPAFLMQIMWISYITLGLIVVSFDQKIDFWGILWIIAAINIFSIGSITGTNFLFNLDDYKNDYKRNIDYNKCKIILVTSISLLLLVTLYNMLEKGININAFLEINTLFDINATAAQERYNGHSQSSFLDGVLSQVRGVLAYITPFISGLFITIAKNKRDKYLSYFSFVPTIFDLMLSNTKLGLIVATFLFVCGYVAMNLMLYGELPKLKLRNFLSYIMVIFLFIGFLFAAMILRVGSYDIEMLNVLKYKFINYVFGGVFAFDFWFSHAESQKLLFGARTINGVSNLLGILSREQGVYKEFYVNGFLQTNIYTAFRGIIEDFGKTGGLIFMYVFGFISGRIHSKVLSSKPTAVSYSLLAACYFFIVNSFFISPWSYSSLIVVFILIVVVLKSIGVDNRNSQIN